VDVVGDSEADIGLLFPDGRWKAFERPGSREIFGIPSPDGRWILHNCDASGRYEVYVVDREGGSRTRISFGGGDDPFWVPTGTRYSIDREPP
jgi:Tol biopolymer transport system component